jgi:hypothetical protein
METGLIHFETYQAVSFTIATAIFIYFTISLVCFIISRAKQRRKTRREMLIEHNKKSAMTIN